MSPRPVAEIVREQRVRRAAEHQRLRLSRSRRRDTRAVDYGKYTLTDVDTGAVVFGGPEPYMYSATLDEVEEYLNRPRQT
ncbi:hypothetical protein [Georgenia sp. AZ-5]|uniref:hypothetical protein n=1 Tax=Georgenia sp. AZ-5 TaxID=3367526 RepID=UPI0037548198